MKIRFQKNNVKESLQTVCGRPYSINFLLLIIYNNTYVAAFYNCNYCICWIVLRSVNLSQVACVAYILRKRCIKCFACFDVGIISLSFFFFLNNWNRKGANFYQNYIRIELGSEWEEKRNECRSMESTFIKK